MKASCRKARARNSLLGVNIGRPMLQSLRVYVGMFAFGLQSYSLFGGEI